MNQGSCLCGEVKLKTSSLNNNVSVCHCDTCRKWGGGPLFNIDCGQDLIIEGIENVEIYNSSDWCERGFCKKCGSHLFYRLKESLSYIVLPGIFDDISNYKFGHQIFIDKKPKYYSFANKTQNKTKSEVLELYSPTHN